MVVEAEPELLFHYPMRILMTADTAGTIKFLAIEVLLKVHEG